MSDAAPPPFLVFPERSLRRLGERFPGQELQFCAEAVSLGISQQLFGADGASRGAVHVQLHGELRPGGLIELNTTPHVTLVGPVPDDEADYIRGLGRDFALVMLELCRCGRVSDPCDCCAACDGEGHVPVDGGRAQCVACGGKGYGAGPSPANAN
jgi:hypothetical protein